MMYTFNCGELEKHPLLLHALRGIGGGRVANHLGLPEIAQLHGRGCQWPAVSGGLRQSPVVLWCASPVRQRTRLLGSAGAAGDATGRRDAASSLRAIHSVRREILWSLGEAGTASSQGLRMIARPDADRAERFSV
jgi:hypothetical protein